MRCVVKAHGGRYELEDPGGLIGGTLRKGVPYEARVLEHIFRQGFEGVAVDVGAGVGNHSLWLAAVCRLEVEAFEPLDHDRLRENVALNDLPITVHPIGLGDETREGEVTPAPEHVTGRALTDEDEVPIRPLDSFELDGVSVIKIDVEGMEPEVLRGAAETINRFHPRLYVEAVDQAAEERNAKEIPRGYRHTKTFGATPLQEWKWVD